MSTRGETQNGTKATDADLVKATLGGDRDSFDQLMLRYESKIFNLAIRVTGNRDDAMDASQAAFLKAHDSLPSFDPTRPFFSWIYRIGLNESLNLIKHRKRYASQVPEIAERAPSPEQISWGHETGRVIQAALQSLSEDYRVAVVLRHIHGLSYKEMSEVIGVPVKTVRSRLFSARRELRQRLTREGLAS